MIVRVWRAHATPANAPAYREHLQTHVFPTLKSLNGFISADLMERADGDLVELVVTTRWQSLRSVREFAGDTYEKAVVAPGARAVLAQFDDDVSHYEVTVEGRA